MKVAEYRDMISDLSDTLASARSAATEEEMERECRRVIDKIKALEAVECPRATARDKSRAEQLIKTAGQFTFSVLMAIYDNERVEAEHMGTPYLR